MACCLPQSTAGIHSRGCSAVSFLFIISAAAQRTILNPLQPRALWAAQHLLPVDFMLICHHLWLGDLVSLYKA